ncbi:MAG: GFA family protein [Sphingomonadaceae bacterium]|nr:GFA family protein [Sphingomonadaceae bacterium]
MAHGGGCACGRVRYKLEDEPLFVHCCHCRWCQRETGSAFALNALIETDRIALSGDAPEPVETPTSSGRGQTVLRCPDCRIALWSHYGGAGALVAFVRVGTLDNPDACPPSIHIYTESKQPWVALPPEAPAVATYYDWRAHWPAASIARREALRRDAS